MPGAMIKNIPNKSNKLFARSYEDEGKSCEFDFHGKITFHTLVSTMCSSCTQNMSQIDNPGFGVP